jgi:hypothetical protein
MNNCRGKGRDLGVRARGRAVIRALPRGLQEDADVIGDALERRFRFHEGELIRVCEARLDARMNARIDARAPERPDARAPDAELPGEPDHIWDCRMHDYASVSHPHGEALGPGARCICTEREKNAKSAGHTRRSNYRSIYRRSALAC